MLPHEHLITTPPVSACPDSDYRLDDVEKAIEEVDQFKRAGGTALVEMTPDGYGRDVGALQRIARETGVYIVSTTGFMHERFMPADVFSYSQSQLVDLLVNDVQVGMDGTDAKAGLIKCGTSLSHISKAEEKVIRAAAEAQRATGTTISTHTTDGTMAFPLIEVLTSEGADLSRVVIGHLDRKTLNVGYLKRLASTGVYVQLDNVGRTSLYPDSLRIDIIKQLIDLGLVEHILLSHDNGRRSYFTSYGGAPGLEYIPQVFTPLMREAGISDADIEQMTVLNPRTALAFEPKL